jgi:hypothetical protein
VKRAVVTGMIATFPMGGVAWDYGQYAIGLEDLGYEVYYLEDNALPTYDPQQQLSVEDCSYGVRFLRDSLAALSPRLADRWHFRDDQGQTYGMPLRELQELLASADLLLNVSGGTVLREEYLACPCKVLLDTDPGWNHFVIYPYWSAYPELHGGGLKRYDHLFTYAERLGQPDCPLPDFGLRWHPTRPPVALDRWNAQSSGEAWTTVMTLNPLRKPVEYQGQKFGAKEMEFPKIESLPQRAPELRLELAVGGAGSHEARWRETGWSVIDSHTISLTLDDYRNYVERSRGELSVAKNVCVATRCGWFSCRSTCYLAASRPVVVQDTGFSEILPTGEGLLAFNDVEQAAAALAAVEADYTRHQRAARELAAEYFNAPRVLRDMLQRIGLE